MVGRTWLGALFLFLAIFSISTLPALAVTAAPNNALVVARVLKVARSEFPGVQIMAQILAIYELEGTAFVPQGQTVTLEPIYTRDEKGSLTFTKTTVENLAAYYFVPGDIFVCELRYSGDEKGGRWWATRIQRFSP